MTEAIRDTPGLGNSIMKIFEGKEDDYESKLDPGEIFDNFLSLSKSLSPPSIRDMQEKLMEAAYKKIKNEKLMEAAYKKIKKE